MCSRMSARRRCRRSSVTMSSPRTCLLTNKLRYRVVPRQYWASVLLGGCAREHAEQHVADGRQWCLDQWKARRRRQGVGDSGACTGFAEPYLSAVSAERHARQRFVAEQMWWLERDDFLDDVRSWPR